MTTDTHVLRVLRYLGVITGTDPQLSVLGVAAVVLGVPLAHVPLLLLLSVRSVWEPGPKVHIVRMLVLRLVVVYCRVVGVAAFVADVVQLAVPVDAALALEQSRGRR